MKDDISDSDPGSDGELREEYDLSQLTGGVRGKYTERLDKPTLEELVKWVRKRGPVELSEAAAEVIRKQRGDF